MRLKFWRVQIFIRQVVDFDIGAYLIVDSYEILVVPRAICPRLRVIAICMRKTGFFLRGTNLKVIRPFSFHVFDIGELIFISVELVDEIVKIFQDLFDFAVYLLLKLDRLSIHLLAIGAAIGGATTRFPLRFLLCSLQHLLELLVFRCLLF